ncbi:MAG: hypothetical protein ACFCUT_11725 [Kiloniellaceae bacterium]
MTPASESGVTSVATVTPALLRAYDRRARDLRAEAQSAALRWLFGAPLRCCLRLRFPKVPTRWTRGC